MDDLGLEDMREQMIEYLHVRASLDQTEWINPDGTLKVASIHELPKAVRQCISSVETTDKGGVITTKVKFHKPQPATKLLKKLSGSKSK